MAIAFDNKSGLINPISTGGGGSFTTSGTNIFVWATIIYGFGSQAITSVTYGGQSMTFLNDISDGYSNGATHLSTWYISPALSGANSFVVNFTGGSTVALWAASYNGANAGAPEATNTSVVNDSGSPGSSYSVSVTTATNNAWLIGMFRIGNTASAGSNTTLRDGTTNLGVMDSNAAESPAGSYSLNVNNSANHGAGLIGASLAPYSAPTGNHSNFLAFM